MQASYQQEAAQAKPKDKWMLPTSSASLSVLYLQEPSVSWAMDESKKQQRRVRALGPA